MNIFPSHHRRKLLAICTDLARADSVDAYTDQITRFIKNFGFRTISATVVIDYPSGMSEFQCVHNTPLAYQESFFDLDLGVKDPVCQHCKNTNELLVWNQSTYTMRNMGELWEHQAYFGYKTGVALGMHFPNGKHFMFAADGDLLPSKQPKVMKSIISDFKIFSSYAQAKAFELSSPSWPENCDPSVLTARERVLLYLTMNGKITSEVASVMNISDQEVQALAKQVMRKLHCNTKYEAVLKAIGLGVIICD